MGLILSSFLILRTLLQQLTPKCAHLALLSMGGNAPSRVALAAGMLFGPSLLLQWEALFSVVSFGVELEAAGPAEGVQAWEAHSRAWLWGRGERDGAASAAHQLQTGQQCGNVPCGIEQQGRRFGMGKKPANLSWKNTLFLPASSMASLH